MCGEKLKFIAVAFSMWGSPPHVRGKASWQDFVSSSTRITPACAGKSLQVLPCGSICKDHPRMCGEKHNLNRFFDFFLGSPPHVRGKA